MTREEAVKTLKENLCGMCAYGAKCMELCDIRGCDNRDAIKALEQEPCEDAISRQAVINALWKEPSYTDPLNVLTEAREWIAELQPIQPQQKVGRWIRVHYISDGKDTAMNKCSNCQEEFGWDIETGISFEDYKYCPNCGAKMEREDKK